MLTCKDFLKELNEYLEPDTDPAVRAELEQHVSECPNCWVVVDTTKKTLKVYKDSQPQELPETVHNRLMEALQKKCGPPSSNPVKH